MATHHSQVLLGIVDEKVDKFQTDWMSNKIGGIPDWITDQKTPNCSECKREMVLVIQLYCPLGTSTYHRTLYIFTCCNDSKWTVIRQQKLDDSRLKSPEKPQSSIKTDDWGVGEDDWGIDNSEMSDDWGTSDTNDNNGAQSQQLVDSYTDSNNQSLKDDIDRNELGIANNFTDIQIDSNSKANNENQTKSISKTDDTQVEQCKEEDNLVADFSSMEVENDTESSNVFVEDDSIDTSRVNSIVSHLHGSHHGHDNQESHASHVTSKSTLFLESYYISVVEEPWEMVDSSDSKHINQLLKQYEREQGPIEDIQDMKTGCKGGSSEKYEKAAYGDKYFHKFSKRVAQLPGQIIRYEWNGEPLYISKPDPDCSSITKQVCPNCGSQVVFELQIMPALIYNLSFIGSKDLNIEFGTVLVYTCKSSCWSEDSKQKSEFVTVQPDPYQNLIKQNVVNKIKT